jgi:hypothetical protein
MTQKGLPREGNPKWNLFASESKKDCESFPLEQSIPPLERGKRGTPKNSTAGQNKDQGEPNPNPTAQIYGLPAQIQNSES